MKCGGGDGREKRNTAASIDGVSELAIAWPAKSRGRVGQNNANSQVGDLIQVRQGGVTTTVSEAQRGRKRSREIGGRREYASHKGGDGGPEYLHHELRCVIVAQHYLL